MVSSRRILTFVAATATAALLALPALASANVYCVGNPGAGCNTIETADSAGLQQALTDAQNHAGADSVQIVAGTYTASSANGFTYSAPAAVDIVGAGAGVTTIAMPNPGAVPASFTQYFGLHVTGAGSSISELSLNMPTPADTNNTNQQFFGIYADADNSNVSSLTVTGPAAAINGEAVVMSSGSFSNSSVSMPVGLSGAISTAFSVTTTTPLDLTANDDTLIGDGPVYYSNPNSGLLHLKRSTLRAGSVGVTAPASNVAVEDSVIDLGSSPSAWGLLAGYNNPGNTSPSSITANNVTIYGSGGSQLGAYAFGNDLNSPPTPGDTASITLDSSIIDLEGSSHHALRRIADNNGIVNITTSYSNYDAASNLNNPNPNGATGGITQTSQTNLTPGFVTPGSDYHLQASSPLIDAGNPAAPPTTETDLDSNPRQVLGKDGCAPRRDIGAYEFQPSTAPSLLDCMPPETSLDSGPSGTIKSRTPTFTFSSTESPAAFRCSIDGGVFASCSSPLTSAPLADGAHTFAVEAVDGSLNVDPTPASRSFTVDSTGPETTIGSHPKPKTRGRRASFSFSASEPGSSFQCSYDGKPSAPCTSPFTTPKLKVGKHRFDVLATDSLGNRDQTAATFLWKVVKRRKG